MTSKPVLHGEVAATTRASATALCSPNSLSPTSAGAADCPFCPTHLNRSRDPHDQILALGPGVNLLPALGMLTPGHFLVATEEHVLSMAELGTAGLIDLASWLTRIQDLLTTSFGNYFSFEHGSSGKDNGAACIDHAHIHLLPLADRLSEELGRALPWITIPDYHYLAAYARVNYAYLSLNGRHLVDPGSTLPSQWVRRKAASALFRDDWDWCLTRNAGELDHTLQVLKGLQLRILQPGRITLYFHH